MIDPDLSKHYNSNIKMFQWSVVGLLLIVYWWIHFTNKYGEPGRWTHNPQTNGTVSVKRYVYQIQSDFFFVLCRCIYEFQIFWKYLFKFVYIKLFLTHDQLLCCELLPPPQARTIVLLKIPPHGIGAFNDSTSMCISTSLFLWML